MSWLAKFDEQWNTFMNIVENKVRREVESQNHLEIETINRLIQEEVRRSWLSSTHLNGAWLRNLKHDYPELGEELQEKLVNLRIKQSYIMAAQFPSGPLLASLGLTGATFVLTRILVSSPWAQLATTAFVGISGGSIVRTMWNNQKQVALNEVIRQLRLELDSAVQSLQTLVRQADGLNESSTSH